MSATSQPLPEKSALTRAIANDVVVFVTKRARARVADAIDLLSTISAPMTKVAAAVRAGHHADVALRANYPEMTREAIRANLALFGKLANALGDTNDNVMGMSAVMNGQNLQSAVGGDANGMLGGGAAGQGAGQLAGNSPAAPDAAGIGGGAIASDAGTPGASPAGNINTAVAGNANTGLSGGGAGVGSPSNQIPVTGMMTGGIQGMMAGGGAGNNVAQAGAPGPLG